MTHIASSARRQLQLVWRLAAMWHAFVARALVCIAYKGSVCPDSLVAERYIRNVEVVSSNLTRGSFLLHPCTCVVTWHTCCMVCCHISCVCLLHVLHAIVVLLNPPDMPLSIFSGCACPIKPPSITLSARFLYSMQYQHTRPYDWTHCSDSANLST